MKKQLDVTISIVSYNTKEYLKKSIDSIINHTRGITFEIIVVDNASSDGTQKFVKDSYPKLKLIKNKKNKFYAGANNQALRIARGKNFLILNADTWFRDNSIKKMADYMDGHEDIGAIEGLEIYEDGKMVPNGSGISTPLIDFYELSILGKKIKNKKLIDKYRYSSKNRKETFEIKVGCDAFLMVRTNLMKKIKGYDEKLLLYYTENDLCLRIIKQGYKVIHYGDAYVYHKISVSANKLKWKKLDIYYKDLLYYHKKHGFGTAGILLYTQLKLEMFFLKIFRPNMF